MKEQTRPLANPIGCQTYTWQALRDQGRWNGSILEVLDAIAEADFDGVETTPTMLGSYIDQPDHFKRELDARSLQLAAIALSTPYGWSNASANDAEVALADRVIRFLEAFGAGARLALGGGRSVSREDYDAKFANMVDQYHRVAARAIARGLVVNVHPTSTTDSLIRKKVEYERLVAALDPILLSLGPDTGHITRGDETALAFVERHRDRITHIHLQDARTGGDFVFMGTGDANLPAVLARLAEHKYAGWLISEEESAVALHDPRATVRACRQYLRNLGH